MPYNRLEGMYRLQETKYSDKEGPFSIALNGSTSGESFRAPILLFSRWLPRYFQIEIVVVD